MGPPMAPPPMAPPPMAPPKLKPKQPAAAPAPVPAAPAAINPQYRRRLLDFYTKFNPTKVADVDGLLVKYRGKEAKLFRSLLKKYPEAAAVLSSQQKQRRPHTSVSASSSSPSASADTQQAKNMAAAMSEKRAKQQQQQQQQQQEDRGGGGGGTGSLPKGFFDDTLRDMKARNVDPEAVKRQQQEAEWEKFQAFAEEVTADDEVCARSWLHHQPHTRLIVFGGACFASDGGICARQCTLCRCACAFAFVRW